MTVDYKDPLNDAMQDDPQKPRRYFGRLNIRADFVTLAKGRQAQPFDPTHDREQDKKTQITITAELLPGQTDPDKTPWIISNGMRAMKWSQEWTITRESIANLNVKPGDLAWCAFELVDTGEQYTSKTTGQLCNKRTFSVIDVYEDEEKTDAAMKAYNGDNVPAPKTETPVPQNTDRRAVALKFLQAMVPGWVKGNTDIGAALKANPMLAEFFTAESPEVLAAIPQA